jgi:integrase/recombinase XerD
MSAATSSFLDYELDSTGHYQRVVAPDSSHLVRGFLGYKKIEACASDLTLQSYAHETQHFCEWLSRYRQRNPIGADHEDVRRYLDKCRHLKPSTVAHRISVLREFFRYLLRYGAISRDPMLRIEGVKKWARLPKAVSEADVRQLIEAPNDPHSRRLVRADAKSDATNEGLLLGEKSKSAGALRNRSICEVLYSSAIRSAELIGLKLDDLDLEQRVATVTGKGEKTRIVPLGGPAIRALQEYLIHGRRQLPGADWSPYLFLSRRGLKLTRAGLWKILSERSKRAKAPHISAHVLRHSAATHLLDHGADLRSIQTILGHADISTTELYCKVSQSRLREAMKRHPRSNPARDQLPLFPGTALALLPDSISSPCIECANPSVPGKTRCARHLLAHREACKRFHARKVAASKAQTTQAHPRARAAVA